MFQNVDFKLDTIAGNAHDLESVLSMIKELIDVKPFIKFELVVDNDRIVPVALVMIGNYTLEILGGANGSRPIGMGHIESIIIETHNGKTGLYELDTGLKIEIKNNKKLKKPYINGFKVKSPLFDEDANLLQQACGFKYNSSTENEISLSIADINVDLIRSNIRSPEINPELVLKNDIYQALPGWHRIGLSCKDIDAATKEIVNAGGKILVSPYKVLPGMYESMIYFPSGLIVQPLVQKLWKMLPVMILKGISTKFTSHGMRFRV